MKRRHISTTERVVACAPLSSIEALVCDVPSGMHVDHKCGNRVCVNPAHLQIARPNENLYFINSRCPR